MTNRCEAFFKKEFKTQLPRLIWAAKEGRIDNRRDNIVKSVSTRRNSKTSNRKENSEINTCNRPKTKLSPVKCGT
jgi:hypothetical protein